MSAFARRSSSWTTAARFAAAVTYAGAAVTREAKVLHIDNVRPSPIRNCRMRYTMRILDVGAAWANPLRQVHPQFFSYSDQRAVIGDHMRGYGVKVI
eukprot:9065097-Pyramimonas_sp.AAC.1